MAESTTPSRVTTCSFCGKSSRDVGKMVEGPGDAYMCVDCADKSREILDTETRKRAPAGSEPVPRAWPAHACSFCGRRGEAAGPMVEGPSDIYACERCVDASLELFRNNGQAPRPRAATLGGPVDEWNGNPVGSRCSFCGRSGRRVGSMVEGPDNLFLCVKCIDAAAAIVADLRRAGTLPPATPSQM